MSGNFVVLFKKFGIPVLFAVASLVLLAIGFSSKQETPFFIATIMMVLASILSILFSAGKLTNKIAWPIGIVAGTLSIVAAYLLFSDVKGTIDFTERHKTSRELAIQNLNDIRDIQKMYYSRHQKYLKTWAEFEDFLRHGTIEHIEMEGSVPKRSITLEERDYLYTDKRDVNEDMTEDEAYRLSKWRDNPNYADFIGFKRDTIQVSLLETKYTNNVTYKRMRESRNFPAFTEAYVDSLKYVPFTNGKVVWKIEALDSVLISEGSYTSVLKVSGKLPYAKDERSTAKEELYFGSTEKNRLDGSWEAQ